MKTVQSVGIRKLNKIKEFHTCYMKTVQSVGIRKLNKSNGTVG